MPNFITFKMAKIDGDDNPKVVKMDGQFAVEADFISGFHTLVDKFDVPVKGVVMIHTKSDDKFIVEGTMEEVMQKISTSFIT